MQGVDAIAQILKREGVEYLFSYPNNSIIDSAAQVGIRPIIARGEKTLINIADGYARATNGSKPTVIVVQAASGIENAFGGLAQAFADSIPILILPGGPDQRRNGGEFDPIVNYHHIMKWAFSVNFVDRVPQLMRRAFTQLRNPPFGPVMLEVPRDVGAADLPDAAVQSYKPTRAYRSAADPADVAEAARLLQAAKRPVLLAGHGVHWAQAYEELRELVELTQAPILTTMAGKSAFPEDHALSLGTSANTVTRAGAHFLTRCDMVLAIGAGLVANNNFVCPIPAGKTLVQITAHAGDVDRDYPIDLAVIGDAKLVLRQLIDEIKRQGQRGGTDFTGEIRAIKQAQLEQWSPRLKSDETPINPYRVIWDLLHTVDRQNTVVTHDSGNPRDQTLTFFETLAPRGYLGWGKSTQLGTGMGVAMGAKLACPEKLCVNIMGDLAFGTAGMEVETAVRERIAIMTVILNNSVMGGYGHHMPNASQRYGSNRLTGEYWKVAEGLGAYAERVEGPNDVVPALKRGIAATKEGRPAVLEMITKEDPVYPTSRALLDAMAKELQPA